MKAHAATVVPTPWWPARRRYAFLALVTGVLTAVLAAALGGPAWRGDLALLYVAIVALAVILPAAVTVQVVTGQLLLATALLGGTAPDVLLLGAAVAGVVATAELLAVVARLDAPMERRPRGDLRRALVAALLGGVAFAAVTLVATMPGPNGLAAVVLASTAVAVLGIALARR